MHAHPNSARCFSSSVTAIQVHRPLCFRDSLFSSARFSVPLSRQRGCSSSSSCSGKMKEIISMLPDEILDHILSFLPTKQVVVTSVLSKRWRLLCTSVDYNSTKFRRKGYFFSSFFDLIEDVNKAILARDLQPSMHPPIRKFSSEFLSCESYHANDVNALINILMRQQHIENLNMILNPIDEISLSCHIFRCKTLVVLKLTFLSMHGCSSTIKLPSLKSLHLVAVDFGKPQDLKKLLYGLPILEDLKLHCIQYNEVDDGSFCKEEFKKLPKLVRADVLSWDDGPDFVPLEAICNVESLSISNGLNQVIPEFPNLTHMVFTFVNNWSFVFEMLKNCPNLQVFELDYFPYDEGDALASFPHSVPQCLTSHLTKCSIQYSGVSDELRFVKYIMQNSTTLRTMTICIDPFQGSKLRREILEELALCPKISPLCELSVK